MPVSAAVTETGLWWGQGVSFEEYKELVQSLGTPYRAHTATERECVDAEAAIEVTSAGREGIHLHAEATYNPRTPDWVVLWCERPPRSRGGRTLLLDGSVLLTELHPTERTCWCGTYVHWRGRDKGLPAVRVSRFTRTLAFANTLLSCLSWEEPEKLLVPDAFELLHIAGPVSLPRTARLAREMAVPVEWKAGDVVLLENSRWLHGREPIAPDEDERRILIATVEAPRPS